MDTMTKEMKDLIYMEMKLKVSFDFPFWKNIHLWQFLLFMYLLVYSFVHSSEMKICFFLFFLSLH